MAITAEQEKEIRRILKQNLLSKRKLNQEDPWGEDSAMYAWELGQPFGAHYLAEELLEVLKK